MRGAAGDEAIPTGLPQSMEMEARLLRIARNDMKISEPHVSTSKVSFLNLDSRIRGELQTTGDTNSLYLVV